MGLPDSVINGRFKVTERPETAPGKCTVCGAVNKPVVDYDATVDFYGAILICGECIREAFIVMVTAHPEYAVQDQVVSPLISYSHLIDAGAVNEYVINASDSIRRLLNILPAAPFDPLEDISELHEDSGESGQEPEATDSAHDESVNESRPTSVPEPASSIFDA